MATKVLEFPQHYRQTTARLDTAFRLKGTELSGSETGRVTMRTEGLEQEAALQALIDIDVLYPTPEGARPDIVQALTSLASAIALLEEARKAAAEGNPISADD